jgi:selenocysteine lyase/cysteine desulfurase
VRAVFRHYCDKSEERPDAFIRYSYPVLLDESRKAIADYLNAPVGNCVFLSNATTGVNTVLRNIVFKPGDVIIYFATIYGACGKSVNGRFWGGVAVMLNVC